MPIKTWTFTFNGIAGRKPPDYQDQHAVQHAFDFNLRQLAGLERIGFEGVFFSEHHFLNSLSPAPNLLVAALAKMTKTLKLGVLGSVLPFHQPWRLAEEIGMLDYITDGRLEIGVVSGVPTEFPFAGIAQDDVRPMFAEALDFLDAAFAAKDVTHHGKFWNYDAIPMLPRIRNEPRRRKWMSAYSEGTSRVAARRGYKLGTAFQSVVNAKRTFDFYRDEADKTGYAVTPDDIALRRQVLIWDDDAGASALHSEAQACARERIGQIFAQVNARLHQTNAPAAQGVRETGIADAPAAPNGNELPADYNPLKGLLDPEDEYIFGAPQTVADAIIDQCRRVGAGNFIAYHPPALEEHELAHLYELWERVVPILRKAEVTAPA